MPAGSSNFGRQVTGLENAMQGALTPLCQRNSVLLLNFDFIEALLFPCLFAPRAIFFSTIMSHFVREQKHVPISFMNI
jgi:hypothetical protein